MHHSKHFLDDQLLLNFLRGSKFSLEVTKEKIDAFYTLRTLAPDIASNFDPFQPIPNKIEKLGMGIIPIPISKEDPAGPRVFIARYTDFDTKEIPLKELVKATVMGCDVLFNECDNYVVSGVQIIWDMKNMKLATAIQGTPDLMRKIMLSFEKSFPVRINGVYFLNAPKYFEPALTLIKMLASRKLLQKFHYCTTSNMNIIFDAIPKVSLPYEYGGEAGYIKDFQEKWSKVVERHRDRLVDERNYCSDESKRINCISDLSNIFGVNGSFRKLEID